MSIELLNKAYAKSQNDMSMTQLIDTRNFQVLMLKVWPDVVEYIDELRLEAAKTSTQKAKIKELRGLLRILSKGVDLKCMCWPNSVKCNSCSIKKEITEGVLNG